MASPTSSRATRSDRPSRIVETCRTCTSCRRKKVKCDSQRPRCGYCRDRGISCEYPRDARRAAVRSRKEDVALLESQVEMLQQQIRKQKSSHQPGRKNDADSPNRQRPSGIEDTASSDAQPPSRAPGQECDPGSVSSAVSSRVIGINNCNFLSPDPTPEVDDIEGDLLPLYGATSLLRHQSSTIYPVNSPQTSAGRSNDESGETAKYYLIAQAALGRQMELSLHSSPSLFSNVDFDNVPMDMALHLLDLHWNRQHLSYLLTYRPAIMDSLVHNGPYVNKLLLNAIYLQSSLYSDRTSLYSNPKDPQTRGIAFYDRFKALLADHIDTPTIPTVVALLTCGACLVPRGKQSAGWSYCGLAYRMILDLGYHLDAPTTSQRGLSSTLTTTEIEMRKRIYWGAYIGDKLQSLFLGRPPALDGTNCNVSLEYYDTFEEMEEWKPYVDPLGIIFNNSPPPFPGRPAYAISTFHCLVNVCKIACRIIKALYSIDSPKLSQSALLEEREELRGLLSRWRDNVPERLRFTPTTDPTPPPHQITPWALHWTLVILVEHAFLDRNHFPFTLEPDIELESKKRCIEAALKIWKLVEAYKSAFTLRRAQYGISYATYCAVLVILRHTDQNSDEYIQCIRFFWFALLEYQRGCNYGLKRPLVMLKSLMQRIQRLTQNINMEMNENPQNTDITVQASFEDISNTEISAEIDVSLFGEGWLDTITQDNYFVDDVVFGAASDDLASFYTQGL